MSLVLNETKYVALDSNSNKTSEQALHGERHY